MKRLKILSVLPALLIFSAVCRGLPSAGADAAPKENQKIDYDLSAMSGSMAYALVLRMAESPEEYAGRTFRVKGLYYAEYYGPTGKYYHYCVLLDAAACCARGVEFVWGDGRHIYPGEYPEEGSPIVVQGALETYREEGCDVCRLAGAEMKAADE